MTLFGLFALAPGLDACQRTVRSSRAHRQITSPKSGRCEHTKAHSCPREVRCPVSFSTASRLSLQYETPMKTTQTVGSSPFVGVLVFALISLGAECSPTTPAQTPDGAVTHADGGPVTATCESVCACLAAACPDYPFLPSCVAACQDTTNTPSWDLSCRATECSAARFDHDGHCPRATGQTFCH